MQIFSLIHSWFRWIVLAAGIMAAGRHILHLMGKSIHENQGKLLQNLFIRSLEIQTALGGILIIWQIFFKQPGTGLLLHGLIGLLPVALAHRILNLQYKWSDQVRAKYNLYGLIGIFILIFSAILLVPDKPYAVLQTTFRDHPEAVRSVEFSPDSGTLASGSFDGSIKLWDLNKETEILEIGAHADAIRDISFSPDGTRIASVSFNQEIKIWSLPAGEQLVDIPAHQASINRVLFEPEKNRIITTSLDNTIKVWDSDEGVLIKNIENEHQGGILGLALSSDGTMLASAGIDGTIRLYDLESDTTTYLGSHSGWAYDLAISPDGNQLASASLDQSVIIWDLGDASRIIQLENLDAPIQSVAYSPEGKNLLAGSASGKIYIWETEGYQLTSMLDAHPRGILDLNFSTDGKWFASGSADTTTKLWKIEQR